MSLDTELENVPAVRAEELTDPGVMRALTHPLRLELIELLWREGSINATEAAREFGESQASCSFHLRQLAKFGFVEEVEGVRGRARPWRLSRRGMRFANVHDDPEADIAWAALERLLRDRQMARYRKWLEGRSRYSRPWRDAPYHSQRVVWLTPEELREVAEKITELLVGLFPDRRDDPAARPVDALAVEVLSIGYPIVSEGD
jgi:predicted ArsR family transcriptional regulator